MSGNRSKSNSLTINNLDFTSGDNSLGQSLKEANDIHIKRIVSSGKFPQESKPEGKVLVLYTGGTIGMVRNKEGGTYICNCQ